jgi:hypothetical protein
MQQIGEQTPGNSLSPKSMSFQPLPLHKADDTMLPNRWTTKTGSFSRNSNASVWTLLKAVLQSTALRLLVATGVCWLVAYNVFKYRLFWREPHSAFFDKTTVYGMCSRWRCRCTALLCDIRLCLPSDLGYSEQRLQQGDELLQKAINEPAWSPALSTGGPVICAAIATVKRQIQYLNGSIGTMLGTYFIAAMVVWDIH